MTQDRKLEILNTMLVEIQNSRYVLGLCDVLFSVFTKVNGNAYEELCEMEKWLKSQKPTKDNAYSHYLNREHWLGREYWWFSMHASPDTRQIRIDYLTELIENESKSKSNSRPGTEENQ